MPRIALVLPQYGNPARPGSAEAFAVRLAEALVEEHEVDLVCARSVGLPPVGARTLVTGGDGLGLTGLARFMVESERLLHRGRYDLILGLGPCRLADLSRVDFMPTRTRERLTGRTSSELWLRRRIEEIQFGPGKRAIGVSPRALERCRAAWPGLAFSRCVPDATPLDLLLPRPPLPPLLPAPPTARERSQARQALGLVARDTLLLTLTDDPELDGTAALIEALAQLPPAFALLVLYGGTSAASPAALPLARLAPLRRLARKLDVAERLVFAPAPPDPLPFFHAADIFALPGVGQALASTALAARAAGLPVLLAEQDGAAPLLDPLPGVALLPPPADDSGVRELVKSLLALSLEPAPGPLPPEALSPPSGVLTPCGPAAWLTFIGEIFAASGRVDLQP